MSRNPDPEVGEVYRRVRGDNAIGVKYGDVVIVQDANYGPWTVTLLVPRLGVVVDVVWCPEYWERVLDEKG